jgi:GNAT superfamily N-acetyltransferase
MSAANGGHEENQDRQMSSSRSRAEYSYRLDPPQCAQDWQAYHGIRRKVFHLPRPEEDNRPGTHPLLLWRDDEPIGAIQVDDLDNAAAALRLVAIDPAYQGGGHGRVMLQQAEEFAKNLGCRRAVVYATPEAAGFYAQAGYDEEDWDDICVGGIVQMLKQLD